MHMGARLSLYVLYPRIGRHAAYNFFSKVEVLLLVQLLNGEVNTRFFQSASVQVSSNLHRYS